MAGISSKAFGKIENRKKFNGIEHTTDLDLNQYDAFYRTLDPQIGRFLQIDPKLESAEAWSPYTAMFNNPIRFMDPLGDSGKPAIPNHLVKAMKTYFGKNAEKKSSGKADDCITCHNTGMKIVTNKEDLKTGSRISETRSKMQQQGLAGPTKEFGFNDANGNTAKSAPNAAVLKEGVGAYVNKAAGSIKPGESAVFGVSIMDGYHAMTLSVSKELITGWGGMSGVSTTYTLSDQGTMGTIYKGNLNVAGTDALDNVLTSYLKANSGATTKNGSSYPATIQLHQIYTDN